ncbi:hypothetical protein Ciccas_008321 [Cichlidogyrus casuarinus]|uniref:Uncharacterized protein n=1 Tax=Cichlidogyrus casuarinus TaxID=1844966 RepID=A0ABD2Q1S0_9PLAT
MLEDLPRTVSESTCCSGSMSTQRGSNMDSDLTVLHARKEYGRIALSMLPESNIKVVLVIF